jgi:hypothetical protein
MFCNADTDTYVLEQVRVLAAERRPINNTETARGGLTAFVDMGWCTPDIVTSGHPWMGYQKVHDEIS